MIVIVVVVAYLKAKQQHGGYSAPAVEAVHVGYVVVLVETEHCDETCTTDNKHVANYVGITNVVQLSLKPDLIRGRNCKLLLFLWQFNKSCKKTKSFNISKGVVRSTKVTFYGTWLPF